MPARMLSIVISSSLGEVTRTFAMTETTARTGPWSSWKPKWTRSSSNRTRGSWTPWGIWSEKCSTRSSASQELTCSSVKTASQRGSLTMSLRSWRLWATNFLASARRRSGGVMAILR